MAKNNVIVFGGGCFWCIEAVFNKIKGVTSTMPGYAGGIKPNPSYEEVCTGTTNHAEVLRIEYDENRIHLEKLLDVFFEVHDPTTIDRQGADYGTQYRSIIFYMDENQKMIIDKIIEKTQKEFVQKIITEVKKLDEFYPAEEYHKNYYNKNSNQPYCNAIIAPKIKKIEKKFKNIMK